MMSIPQFDAMNQSEISKEKKLNKQKLIDICFQIALTINNDKYFSKELSDEEIAEWVRYNFLIVVSKLNRVVLRGDY